MEWTKQGVIYQSNGQYPWNKSHAQVPVADRISADTLRLYYAARDGQGRSHISYIEVDADQPQKILYQHDQPILELGPPGTFDDCGTMPTCVLTMPDRTYLYYIGWTTRGSVPFSNSIGLAESLDGGKSFTKVFNGPIIGAGPTEPYFTGTCYVIPMDDYYMAYYLSCEGWLKTGNKLEPIYNIKMAKSSDARQWELLGRTAIDLQGDEGGIASASVIVEQDLYKMWFSVRGKLDYRQNSEASYRIGYAESSNGLDWDRKSSDVIPVSDQGWDSEMIAYPYVIPHHNALYLFYNGNGFGQTGFGYATIKR